LEAFRALKGAYVYNVAEVVPIEPAIWLDRDDERFVAGRDVLDGMAQGQNLAIMDWQDFEHLIRELLEGACRQERGSEDYESQPGSRSGRRDLQFRPAARRKVCGAGEALFQHR